MTKLSKKTPTMYSRTALGHYPVRVVTKTRSGSAGTSETVTISGFNLGTNTSVDVGSLTTSDDAVTGGKSAPLVVTVAGVNSINNINNNNARGSYETAITDKSSYAIKNSYAYNRMPNNSNNNLLTDDVYFDVWEFNSQAAVPISGRIEQPVMKIRPTDGKIGFAFVNGPLYFSMGGSETSQDYSYQYWSASFDFFTSVGFTYDDAGNSYGVAAGGDINATVGDKFDLFMSSKGTSFTDWNRQESSYYNPNGYRLETIAQVNSLGVIEFDKQRIQSPSMVATSHGTNGNNLYMAYYDSMNDEIRFKAGNTNSTNTTYPYSSVIINDKNYVLNNSEAGHFNPKVLDLAVGDTIKLYNADGTLFDNNEYTVREIGTNNGDEDHTIKISLNGKNVTKFPIANKYGYSKKNTQYNGFGSFIDSETVKEPTSRRITFASLIAGGGTGKGAGEYVGLAVKKGSTSTTDVVHVVWYDTSNRTLRYAYNDSPLTFRNGTEDFSGWKGYTDVFASDSTHDFENAGEYCKIAVDVNGGVHIAAYDPVNLDLVYAYKGSSDTTFKTAVVDANGVVGSNLTLDVALVEDKPVPYIGYYATSCIKPKYARFVGDLTASSIDGSIDDEVTGNWEISVVPTAEVIEMQSNQHNDINISVWKDNNGIIKASTTGNSNTGGTGSGYSATSYGQCYGNGTKNPVLGYAIKNGSSGDTIETAQMR